jgi:hypothetical protein
MKLSGPVGLTIALSAVLLTMPAPAQIPIPIALPETNFTWIWGNRSRAAQGLSSDFTTRGSDQWFNCELTGRMSALSGWSRTDVLDMEMAIRAQGSFIEGALRVMNELDYQRALDWAVLDCERMDRHEGGAQGPQGPQTAVAWLDVEVRLHQDFPAGRGVDDGAWSVSFNQAHAWRLRASRPDSRATFTVRPEGLLLPSALTSIEASAYTVCTDAAGREWRTELSGPAEPDPLSLSATNEGGNLVLWASVPDVLMQQPGHGHIEAGSECRTSDQPSRERLQLDWAALQAAGATMNDSGAFRLGDFAWNDIAAAATGEGPEAVLQMRHEAEVDGRRVVFEINGSLGQRPTN